MRFCKRCEIAKSEDNFYLNKTGYYHPFCKPCNTIRSREWKSNNKHKKYLSDIKHKFNLCHEGYKILFDKQKGLCAICNKEEINRRLSVDHCHKTLAVRGLLCRSCNLAIGYLNDDIKLFKKAIKYLS